MPRCVCRSYMVEKGDVCMCACASMCSYSCLCDPGCTEENVIILQGEYVHVM